MRFINSKLAADLTKPFSRNYKVFERDVKLSNFIAIHLFVPRCALTWQNRTCKCCVVLCCLCYGPWTDEWDLGMAWLKPMRRRSRLLMEEEKRSLRRPVTDRLYKIMHFCTSDFQFIEFNVRNWQFFCESLISYSVNSLLARNIPLFKIFVRFAF